MFLATLALAAVAGPGSPGAAIPLYALAEDCTDSRYPTLAGEWVLGCGSEGAVDRALSLSSGTIITLPVTATSPGVAAGRVYVPGWGGGLIALAEDGGTLSAGISTIHEPPVAPPAIDGERVALLSAGRVQAAELTADARLLHEISPAGWYPPALTDGHVAWVERGEGEDVWWMALPDGTPMLLAGGPGSQRHVVGHKHWLAWVEESAVILLDTQSGDRQTFEVTTGFSAPITLWDGVVCWEQWGADIDIVCSDGMTVSRPGHQQWPSRFGPWLLFREAERVWLLTAD